MPISLLACATPWLRRTVLMLALAGCATEAGDSSSTPIVNGVPEWDYPEVGRVWSSIHGSWFTCTGTLIHPRAVLTAAHCVLDEDVGHAQRVEVNFRDSFHPATHWVIHPEYDGEAADDLAIVFFSEPVRGIEPAVLSVDYPYVGDAVRFVGFGRDQFGILGVKRSAWNTIASVSGETFSVEDAMEDVGNVCHGDSGGPVFLYTGGIIGWVSKVRSGADGTCTPAIAGWDLASTVHGRIDVKRGWIDAQLAANTQASDWAQAEPEEDDGDDDWESYDDFFYDFWY